MSIITNEQPEPTKQQKQAMAARRIQSEATRLFNQMNGTYAQVRKMVWENQQGLTPQEVFDALGTSGAELLQLSNLLVQTVNAVQADTLDGEQPYEFTINQDGTVTVGAKK